MRARGGAELVQRVATELFLRRDRDDPGEHRLGDDGSCRDADGTDYYALPQWDAAHRLRDESVEAAVPQHVTAKPGWNSARDDVCGAPQGVTGIAGGVDGVDHPPSQVWIGAPNRRELHVG